MLGAGISQRAPLLLGEGGEAETRCCAKEEEEEEEVFFAFSHLNSVNATA